MKKLLSIAMLVCLAPLLGGCFLLPAQRYDGSEKFNEAMPQYNDPPSYMQPNPTPLDGR